MPIFPEFLYQLSQRDQQVTWLDPVILNVPGTAAAALTVDNLFFTVPTGQALILTSGGVNCIPGAGQSGLRAVLSLIPPVDTGGRAIFNKRLAAGAGLEEGADEWGAILVPQQWRVRATGVFDAAVNPNNVTGRLTGILIPIGNVQRI